VHISRYVMHPGISDLEFVVMRIPYKIELVKTSVI